MIPPGNPVQNVFQFLNAAFPKLAALRRGHWMPKQLPASDNRFALGCCVYEVIDATTQF
jgi:hypothetical protein